MRYLKNVAYPLLLIVSLLTLSLILPNPAQAAIHKQSNDSFRSLLDQTVADSHSFSDKYEAEAWLMLMASRLERKIPDPLQRLTLLRMVHEEAKLAELKPDWVLSVIEVESNFDRFAISNKGARGLMQVMPAWVRYIGLPGDNLFDIRTNLRYGCTILRYYLDIERGNLSMALARYNGSIGQRWYPAQVYRAHARWRE